MPQTHYNYSALVQRLKSTPHGVRHFRRKVGEAGKATTCPNCGLGPVWSEEAAQAIEAAMAARKHHGAMTEFRREEAVA